jgi:hypothetical protein
LTRPRDASYPKDVSARAVLGSVLVFAGVAGCSPVVASYPKTPVPVLLSRVNRIGVKQPVPTREAGTQQFLRAKAEIYELHTSSTMQAGAVTITTYHNEYRFSGPTQLATEAIELVPNGADAAKADIQLDGIDTGNFAITYSLNSEWATPVGRKVYQR